MSEILQEFVDSGSLRLRVDREAGVIRGVKLLGLSSRNGRRYREAGLVEATALYEGAKVNINHPKGHPLSPRDYQDRLGVIRGVQFRAGEGLFGDLHFNPKHTLSEQLIWDAQHSPQNVGLSHNVLARTTKSGDETVVEAITKVQSIDLVADPATTAGLFEHANGPESMVAVRLPALGRGESQEPGDGDSRPACDSQHAILDALTIEQLELHRPDILLAIRHEGGAEMERLRSQLEEIKTRDAASRRRARIEELLAEHGLSLPGGARRQILSEPFLQSLLGAEDDAQLRRLVEDRAELVRSARHLAALGDRSGRQPRSRDQAAWSCGTSGKCETADQFAAAIKGR